MTFNPLTNLKRVNELECSLPKIILRLTEVFAMKHNVRKKLLTHLPKMKVFEK